MRPIGYAILDKILDRIQALTLELIHFREQTGISGPNTSQDTGYYNRAVFRAKIRANLIMIHDVRYVGVTFLRVIVRRNR